jgi:hypothetical protein
MGVDDVTGKKPDDTPVHLFHASYTPLTFFREYNAEGDNSGSVSTFLKLPSNKESLVFKE